MDDSETILSFCDKRGQPIKNSMMYKLSLPFVFIAQALFFQAAYVSAVTTDPRKFAACVGCRSAAIVNLTNPCLNVRQQITDELSKEFNATFKLYNIAPAYPSLMFETPVRELVEELVGGLRGGSSLSNANRKLQARPVSCRSLCSTYPDCSAWCPSKGRRELEEISMEETSVGDSTLDRDLQTYDTIFTLKIALQAAGFRAFGAVRTKYASIIDATCNAWLSGGVCNSNVVVVGCWNNYTAPTCCPPGKYPPICV